MTDNQWFCPVNICFSFDVAIDLLYLHWRSDYTGVFVLAEDIVPTKINTSGAILLISLVDK
jgi:hypothetical protein